jgi:tetrahydromethanopterin S-methyltransferase subunit H
VRSKIASILIAIFFFESFLLEVIIIINEKFVIEPDMNEDYFSYGTAKLGVGNFELPPILIGTMFYQGQTLIDRKNECQFDAIKAKKRIDNQKSLAKQYKLPELVEISAITPEAMVKYLEFYLESYDPPFVLGGSFDAKIAGIEYLNENGIKADEYIYNSISNLKNKKELELIEKNRISSVVVLILGASNMTSTQRYAYITDKAQPGNVSIIDGLKKLGIEKIWIDGGVIDIESFSHILDTQQIVSKSLKLPVGTAPTLFLFKYSSPRLNLKFHTKYRKASVMFIASWYSNFIFYGAIEDAKECFSSVYQALELKNVMKNNSIRLFDNL